MGLNSSRRKVIASLSATAVGTAMISGASASSDTDNAVSDSQIEDLKNSAIGHISDKFDIEEEDLAIANHNVIHFKYINEYRFKAKLNDSQNGTIRTALLNTDGTPSEKRYEELCNKDNNSRRALYGKKSIDLHQHIESRSDKSPIPITIFLNDVNVGDIKEKVANGRDLTGKDQVDELRQRTIEKTDEMVSRVLPKVESIIGLEVVSNSTGSRTIFAKATSGAIDRLENIPRVSGIYKTVKEYNLHYDNAAKKTLGTFYDLGTDFTNLSDYKVGIGEYGRPENSIYLNIVATRWGSTDTSDHHKRASEVLASVDDDQPGIAKKARIYSADKVYNEGGNPGPTFEEKCNWWGNNDVLMMSASATAGGDERYMTDLDLRANEMVRKHNLSMFLPSGNNVDNPESPSAAFNVNCIGLVNISGTTDPADDYVVSGSGSQNPYSRTVDDFETDDSEFPLTRPSFCVPAGQTDVPSGGDMGGTSAATPMAAGLVPLMQAWDDNKGYGNNFDIFPNLQKAILFAGATRQVGDSDEEGAGTIDGDHVENIIKNENHKIKTIWDDDPAWEFDVNLSGRTRIACVWNANLSANTVWSESDDNKDITADIDFDLEIIPNGSTYPETGSYREDRVMEWVDHSFDSDTYTIKIDPVEWNSSDSARSVAVAWLQV